MLELIRCCRVYATHERNFWGVKFQFLFVPRHRPLGGDTWNARR